MKRRHVNCVVASACVLVCTWLTGCSTTQEYPTSAIGSPFLEEWKPAETGVATNVAVSTVPDNTVSPATNAAETAKIETGVDEMKPLPRQIVEDLSFPADTSVTTVLRALAKVGNVNMVVSPKVDGVVSMTFKSMPWDQAFSGVLTTAGLSYTWDGDILRVMTLDDIKRELEIEKVMHERDTVRDSIIKSEPLVMRVIKVKYMSAKKIVQTVKDMLGTTLPSAVPRASGGTTVSLNDENNSLIVQATQRDADMISELVSKLDHPKLQVRIDASIVEANSSTARQLGIQWGGTYMATEGGKIYTTGAGPGRDWAANFPATFDSKGVGATLGFAMQDFGGAQLLNLQLSALQSDGKARILSSPSVTTLDNETAAIESGEERAYRVTSGTGNNLDTSLAWKKAVLKLEVTPHVIDPSLLRVEIAANKDAFDERKVESNGEYPVSTKNTKTTVLLKNGQTTVIGGLSEKSNSGAETGIPYLKNIPLLGLLFQGSKKDTSLGEVLIFITPTILNEPVTTNLRRDM